jgi:hypothetical protein
MSFAHSFVYILRFHDATSTVVSGSGSLSPSVGRTVVD